MLRSLTIVFTLLAAAGNPSAQDADWHWTPVDELRVEGRPFTGELAAPFDRLPARAEDQVRKPVWDLSRHSAGITVHFATDAPRLALRWTLRSANLAMPHMPATGVSGIDVYVEHASATTASGLRWLHCAKPTGQTTTAVVARDLPRSDTPRRFALYLPLYNGVTALDVGVPPAASLTAAAGRPESRGQPVLFYGTSITHGACASRPGACHVAILGRRLDRETVNLGFSGNGRMEPELGELIAEVDVACYVIDCLPNLDGARVNERLVPFVMKLRKARPRTPIVLAEDRTYADAFLVDSRARRNAGNRKAFQAGVEALREYGIDGLFVVPATAQLGGDGEDTVDGSHPTDLGFRRMADGFEPVLRSALAWQPR